MKLIALLLACVLAQDAPFTKDDVLKLAKAGIGDDVILAKIEQEKAALKFTSQDLGDLKRAGVSEKILARLADLTGKKPEDPPAPRREEPRREEPRRERPAVDGRKAHVRNYSHRDVRVTVNEEDRYIDFRTNAGTDLKQGAALDLEVTPGDYHIAVEGWITTERIRVTGEDECLLTVRGANTEYIDLQTVVAEDADGRRVVILHNQGKVTPGQRVRERSYAPSMEFYGPDWSYFPFVRDSVLVGAGLGAIIGHQSGHRTEGAWIGAGVGWFLGCLW
jgi:hypothetical protein